IAGGPADDMIFGEMGNDTTQGDGSIDYVAHLLDQTTGLLNPVPPTGSGRVTAYRTPGGPSDPTGPLTVYPSFDVPATDPGDLTHDGHDYIEGGGGNDVLFGNQGQDDIVGGSSDFFCWADNFGVFHPSDSVHRPDGTVNGKVPGDDLIFGGSGL